MQTTKQTGPQGLKIWEKITIVVGEGSEAGLYEARVEEVLNGGIVITKPEFVSGRTLLRNDLSVVVQVTRDDAVYQFRSSIKSQSLSGNERVVLTPPASFQRLQRRQFVRVETPARVQYAAVSNDIDWALWQEELAWHTTYAKNISAGGILICLEDGSQYAEFLALKIDIFSDLDLPETILAIECRRFAKQEQRFCGMKFIRQDMLKEYFSAEDVRQLPEVLKSFDKSAQDKLVTFLFQQQVELRRKGLI